MAGTTATNVSLSDPVPSGTTSVSRSFPAGWTCADTLSLSCTRASLTPADGPQVFTFVVRVNGSAADGTTITNTATVSADGDTAAAGNNVATATTTVDAPQADVSVTKTDSPDPVAPGGDITYTITVQNTSTVPSTTGTITVTDLLPAGTTFVSLTGTFPWASADSLDPGQPCTTPQVGEGGMVTCQGSLGPAGLATDSATFTLVVQVDPDAQGSITNTATATLQNDPDLTNNTAIVVTNVTPAQDVRAGKGCGDKNHVHEREARCKKAAK